MKQNKTDRLQAEVSKIRKIKISSRGRTPDGGPNPIDTHVGNRIRLRRQLLGYSQEKLASLLGLTFQQVQKYERGMNRVGASRLWDIGNILNVPVSFFYDDMDPDTANQSPRMFQLSDTAPQPWPEVEIQEADPMSRDETIQLIKAYYKIPNRKAAQNIFDLIIGLSKPYSQSSLLNEE